MKRDLHRRRAALDDRCEQIDAAYRRLLAVHGASEDEVYRLLHPPLASELRRRKDAHAKILKRLEQRPVDLQERRRLLPSPEPPRSRAQPIRNRRLREIGRNRWLVTLHRADIWCADERQLRKIERQLSTIDLAGLEREARRHHIHVIGGVVKASHRQKKPSRRSRHWKTTTVRHLGTARKTDSRRPTLKNDRHPDHYARKVLVVRLRRQSAQYLSLDACARIIADRAKFVSADQVLTALKCKCPDPPGYRLTKVSARVSQHSKRER